MLGSGAARSLGGSWAVAAIAPGRAERPADLEALEPDWIPCEGPMPAAAALRAAGRWDLDHPRDFDADDWWYRCRFAMPEPVARQSLRFAGLATIAEVWLNGTHILRSESMFIAHTVDLDALRASNELMLRFHALGPLLAARRPRPHWRTGLVAHQQLRWHRTALLGRIPAWCPPVAPVGPWRPVLLEPVGPLRVDRVHVRAELDGDDGVVRVSIRATGIMGGPTVTATLAVGASTARSVRDRLMSGEIAIDVMVRLTRVERWWPHTHGPQPLFPVRLSIAVDGDTVDIDLGRVGFRTVEVDHGADGNGFGLVVNGVAVFCRGTCWTTLDVARLDASAADYRAALERLRDAGMNMVRVGGTMAYETDAFHDLCDELGILVWQDFMFASMDYPSSDEAFSRTVTLEARQILEGLQGRPSLAVVCGNSEVAQQAAMLGLSAERWTSALFAELLPALVESLAPGVAWLPSTPNGGAFPFQADSGVAHYYGVGAYRRPLDDARRAGVRFATECLAFSNVPDATMVDRLVGDGGPLAGHPRWKARVPRDAGADWDFEDVRDHYVKLLFDIEPGALRACDPARYLALGRVASGEVMLRTFAEWRRPGSSCRGGLVWFARDLWPGAGWGVVDSDGRPKAAYWYLKRVLAPVALLAADEGLNGLWLHAVNDTADPIEAELRVTRYREGRQSGTRATAALTIPARSARTVHADTLYEGFRDLTYAYRFGPPGHDVVAATLRRRASDAILAAAHWFPCGLPSARERALGLVARATPIAGGYALILEADRFAHAVAVDAEGFTPDDSYLHLEPGEPRRLVLRADVPGRPLCGSVSALNGTGPVPITCAEALHGD
jgi:beta-mannosidase